MKTQNTITAEFGTITWAVQVAKGQLAKYMADKKQVGKVAIRKFLAAHPKGYAVEKGKIYGIFERTKGKFSIVAIR